MKLKFFLIAAFTIYALTTGGLVVYNSSNFGGQNDIRLVESLKSDVWLEPSFSSFGVPFIFHYHVMGKPFSLRLQIWDESKQYQKIDITEVVIEYPDGEVIRKQNVWSRKLKPYTQHNSSSSGDIKTEMFMLSDRIEGLILRNVNVKISLKGQLIKDTGERLPFGIWEEFKAKSELSVITYWAILAGFGL
jgi:hypothetical protein